MTVREDILQILRARQWEARPWLSSSELAVDIDTSWSTVKRQLDALLKAGMVIREGRAEPPLQDRGPGGYLGIPGARQRDSAG